VLAFAAIYVVWGSTYLAIRFGVESIPPFFMASARFLVAGVLLFAWRRWVAGDPIPPWPQWRSALIIGGLLLLVGNGGVTWAEQTVPSGVTALLIATVPLWFVLHQWAWMKGGFPSRATLAGLVLGFAGVSLLLGPESLTGAGGIDLAGVGALMISTIAWSGGSLYSTRAPLPASPLMSTALQMLCGGALLLLFSGISGELALLDPGSFTPKSVASVVYLMVFGSLIAFSAYVWLLTVVPASRVATYAYVNPVIAVLLGWALAGEDLSARGLAGAAVIVLSVLLVQTGKEHR
jgi:drug/metabolite transporter (DMT)-like permease